MEILMLVVGLILAMVGSVFLSQFGLPDFVSALSSVVSMGSSLGVIGLFFALLIGLPVIVGLYAIAGVIGLIPVAIKTVGGLLRGGQSESAEKTEEVPDM